MGISRDTTVRGIAAFVMLGPAWLMGLSCAPAPDSAPEPRVSSEPVKNCLFIILDASAAAHFGAWGYQRDTTPNIDALAEEGFVFANAQSQDGSTMPSTWSFLTGHYPLRPPTPELTSESYKVRDEDVSLAQTFKNGGFRTLGFSQNPFIRERWRYDRGFDAFRSYKLIDTKTGERDAAVAAQLFPDIRDSIASAEQAGDRWFAYVHYLRPHDPYTAPEPFGEKFMAEDDLPSTVATQTAIRAKSMRKQPVSRAEVAYMINSYDGGLAYADHEVGELIDWLRDEGILDDTLVVIAGDHGEGFMQHGLIGHGYILFQEMLHVPMLFRAPKDSGLRPGRTDTLVEMVDLYPTFVELFDLPAPPYKLDGQSLVPALRGESIAQKPISYAQIFNGYTISVRIGDIKMITDVDWDTLRFSNIGVFNLREDPLERVNLFGRVPLDDHMRAAAAFVARWDTDAPAPEVSQSELPDEVVEELEALGYLSE